MSSLALTHARFQLTGDAADPDRAGRQRVLPGRLDALLRGAVRRRRPGRRHLRHRVDGHVRRDDARNLFQYGIGVAEDRAQPWDPYTRTLPAGPGPRFAGRILAGLALMTISLIPVVVIAALLTAATVTAAGVRWLAFGARVVIAVPFILMGLAIGYALPSKAAIVVAQVLFFPLAFGGGLMTAPGDAPGFVEDIAPYLPTGGAARADVGGGRRLPVRSVVDARAGRWTVVLAGVAVWAYRRDEGRRFS